MHRKFFKNQENSPKQKEYENPEGKKQEADQIIPLRVRKALNFPVAIP